MKRALKTALLLLAIVLCCGYCAFLWLDYNSRNRQLERLQEEVTYLNDLSAQNEAVQKTYGQFEELERLRRNHFELGELAAKIAALREAQAQRNTVAQKAATEEIGKLQLENAQLRAQLEQMKASPGSIEDRRSVDGSELEQISYFFRAYARNNSGKYPTDFTELRYYLPATVYPAIETNRFEILSSDPESNPDPTRQPIVRTRIPDAQSILLYLFADGHLETRHTLEN